MVVTALFTLLYVYRRRAYILQWVSAWVLFTGALSVAARDTQQATVALLMLGFSRFLSLTAILAIASSPLTFRNRRWLDCRYLLGLAPILGWCVASPFLFGTRQKPRYIFKCYKGHIKSITETDKTGTLYRRINIQHTCQMSGLIGNDSNRPAAHSSKTNNDIFCKF